jgi:Domain of unknown function (DUF397)
VSREQHKPADGYVLPAILSSASRAADQLSEDAVARPEPTEWRHSVSSESGAGVEVSTVGEMIAVRSADRPDERVLIPPQQWRVFITDVKNGLFDSGSRP